MISRFSKIPQLVQPVTDLGLGEIKEAIKIKNAKIEQGYTAVLSNIDKISNLDVMRGVDQEYIRTTLNSTINKLNSIDGGNLDLSDIRNTYQLNDMVTSVTDDSIIQNAIKSTAYVKNVLKQREQINTNPKLKKGLISQVNEGIERDEINRYLTSGDINDSFGLKNAIIGMDTDEYMTTIAKAVKASVTEEKRNSDPFNNWIITKKTPASIENAIIRGLQDNPEAIAQMNRNFSYLYKNKDKMISMMNNEQKSRLDTNEKDIIEYDTQIALGIKQGVDVSAIKALKDEKVKLRENYSKKFDINTPDDELKSKAFNTYVSSLAQDYGTIYKEYTEKSKIDAGWLAAQKLNLEAQKFKYEQQDDNINRAFDKYKFDINTGLKKDDLRLKEAEILSKVSPSAGAEYMGTGKMPTSFSEVPENPFNHESKTMPSDFDAIDFHNKTTNELKNTNLKLASEIVESLTNQGSVYKTKIDDMKAKGLIKPTFLNGKEVKGKYFISPNGLKVLETMIESIDQTQGQVLSSSMVNVKNKLDIIEKNNFKFAEFDFFKTQLLKDNGLTEQQLREGGNLLSQTGLPTEFNIKKDNYTKALTDFYQSSYFNSKVPIAKIRKDADKKDASYDNLRIQLLDQIKSSGLYSPINPSKMISSDGVINGKKVLSGNVSEKLKEVDWENSMEHVIPGSDEVEIRLKDFKGEAIIDKDYFPDGVLLAKISSPLVSQLIKTYNPSYTSEQFKADDKYFDVLNQMSEKYANDFLKGQSFNIPGVSSSANLRLKASKSGDKYFVNIPALGEQTFETNSIDDFSKNLAYTFNQLMETAKSKSTDPRLNTEQKRVNESLKALKEVVR
jgi:DNA-binding PadR family transcriptional regulator